MTNFSYSLLNSKNRKLAVSFGIFTFSIVFFLILTAVPTFAMSMGGETSVPDAKNMSPIMRLLQVNNPLYTPLDVILDVISLVLMLIACFTIIKSIREYRKSTIGIALLYFLSATLVLGAIRLIFILDDNSIYNVQNITEMTSWHGLFYYAIILFYLAGKTLTRLVSSGGEKSSYAKALSLLIFSLVLSAGVIISMPYMDNNFLLQDLQNTWFESFGWFHIIALVMSASIAAYLYRVKNKFKGYTGMIGDIYISLALLATIHFWELLRESWRWINVSSDFGEFVERCIWIPVFIFILYSFIKLRKMTTSSPAALSESEAMQPVPPALDTPPTQPPAAASETPSPTIPTVAPPVSATSEEQAKPTT